MALASADGFILLETDSGLGRPAPGGHRPVADVRIRAGPDGAGRNLKGRRNGPRCRRAPGPRSPVSAGGSCPHWADDLKIGYSLINARSETAACKPAFRGAFRDRRCLILTDGFYEWHPCSRSPTSRRRQTACHRGAGCSTAAFGRRASETPVSPVLTTDANDLMRPVHDRMPVIRDPGNFDRWLDPTLHMPADVQPFLTPYPAEWFQAIPGQQACISARTPRVPDDRRASYALSVRMSSPEVKR